MGNSAISSVISNYITFEDMQSIIKKPHLYTIINTLSVDDQHCLIANSKNSDEEEKAINSLMMHESFSSYIVIYGYNCNDEKIYHKYRQLKTIGFRNIYIYTGGMFEWLLLQDVYGKDEFQTTSHTHNILYYRPKSILKLV